MHRGFIFIGMGLVCWGCSEPSSTGPARPGIDSAVATDAEPLTRSTAVIAESPASAPTIASPATEQIEDVADDPFSGEKAGQERDDNVLALKRVWCPPGEFLMGEESSSESAQQSPVRVRLRRGFWLGKFEVTQAQWTQMMQTEPWSVKYSQTKSGDDYPATGVTWDDAQEFCRRLSEQEHAAGRLPAGWQIALPTEAQWEYACRAGTTTRYSYGNDPEELSDYGWFLKNAAEVKEEYGHQVGLKLPNAWGLYDMHGNVWELCRDDYVDTLPGGIDPVVSAGGLYRVIRGGSWNYAAKNCRTASRRWNVPRFQYNYVGFRVVWSSDPTG